jgi:hypothetical protein
MNPNDPNVSLLERAVGGAVAGVLITDPAMPEIRPTQDVDVICRAIARAEYHVTWTLEFDPKRLTQPVQALLVDSDTTVLVSAATVWELSLTHHQGKLPELEQAIVDLAGLLQADGFQALPHPLVTAMAPRTSRF